MQTEEPRSRSRVRGSWADRIEVAVPVLGYVAAVLAGATTSSLNALQLRQNPGTPPDLQLGKALPVRSDEWFTQVPLELQVIAEGEAAHSPLAHGPDLIYQLSSGQPFETVLFMESNLLRLGPVLPDEMVFAAFRGFSWLLLLLCLPPLLRRLGATRLMSWLAVALCFFAPASAWWSFMPIRILGFAAAGSYLLVLARDALERRRWATGRARGVATGLAVLYAAVGGVLLARLATYYPPWGLTTGVPLVLAVVVWLVWSRETRRLGLLAIGIGAVVGGVVLAGTVVENLDALRAELNTAYPGLRRNSGFAQPIWSLFAGPGLFELDDDPVLAASNTSELSQAFLVCGLWAALLWGRLEPTLDRARRAVLWVLAGAMAVWGSWVFLTWGPIGEKVPLLNLVPPQRVAQTLGFTAALLLCLVLSQSRPVDRTRHAVAVGAGCALLTGYAVSALREVVTSLDAPEIWATAVVTGVLVAAVTRFPRHWAPATAVVLVTGFFALSVNPVVLGLGDLRGTEGADRAGALGARAKAEGVHVVADEWGVDALLVANGAPALTGYQVTGPVMEQWEKVDPDGQYELEWNRGASYLKMAFTGEPGSEPVITNPSPDVIQLTVDPCWVGEAGLDIGYVVSSNRELPTSCLERVGRFTWTNTKQFVYEVR